MIVYSYLCQILLKKCFLQFHRLKIFLCLWHLSCPTPSHMTTCREHRLLSMQPSALSCQFLPIGSIYSVGSIFCNSVSLCLDQVCCTTIRPNAIFNRLMTLRSSHYENQIICYMTCCVSGTVSKPKASEFGFFPLWKQVCMILKKGGFYFYCPIEVDLNYKTWHSVGGECLLSFCGESFVIHFAIRECKD